VPVPHTRTTRRAAVAATAALAAVAVFAPGSAAADPSPFRVASVAAANTKTVGIPQPNVLAAGLVDAVLAQGSARVENPTGYATHYGYNGDDGDDGLPFVPLFTAPTSEARKTEPDKNTYLVLRGQHGADAAYDYGTHFLFQGHETGKGGYVTRVNLDADGAHKVTVLATKDTTGKNLPTFDGSTWDPFSKTLLLTAEGGKAGGVWQLGADFAAGAAATPLLGSLGQGGYEGIQLDADGNVWIVEDVGGAAAGANKAGKQPNSFVYRFVPAKKGDLSQGRLQALAIDGAPSPVDADSQFEADLHTYGKSFTTRWVTVHDTATDGTAAFDANAAAKAKGATPLKRPENGVFRPGSDFREFYFTETGDTNATSPFNATKGGWGAVFGLSQKSPSADTGVLRPAFVGDQAHTGFDNLAFADTRSLLVVEDAGDLLHTQRNALDSGYVVDVKHDYADGAVPDRFLAEGRDASATIDSALSDARAPGFANDGDNEITGIHVSDGDAGVGGLLGAKEPQPFGDGWRVFWTQQHGDNVTHEILSARR
jgi:Bacterial protein of unknown function (DUF839)